MNHDFNVGVLMFNFFFSINKKWASSFALMNLLLMVLSLLVIKA